jgi:hypothetical protein
MQRRERKRLRVGELLLDSVICVSIKDTIIVILVE